MTWKDGYWLCTTGCVMAAVRVAMRELICTCNKEYEFSKGLRSNTEIIWQIRTHVFSGQMLALFYKTLVTATQT
jgi:hypothetical protein